jgi:hypothetical protein
MEVFVAEIASGAALGTGSVLTDRFGGDACLSDCSGYQVGY